MTMSAKSGLISLPTTKTSGKKSVIYFSAPIFCHGLDFVPMHQVDIRDFFY